MTPGTPVDLDALLVVHQPVVDLRSGRVVATEALARIRLADGSLAAPASFLPALEADGRISELDSLVAGVALAQLSAWRARWPGRPLSVALNISPCDLDDPSLPDRLQAAFDRHGVPADAVVIEVTETMPSLPGRGHEQVLERLARLGCNVTLDDFGTGFSSFTHLQRFPVAGVKIDRSFTCRLGEDPRSDTVVAGLVGLGTSMGLHVVAEGIETLDQLRALQRLGCPFGQGYLFSRPVPAEEIGDLLEHGWAATALSAPRRTLTPVAC